MCILGLIFTYSNKRILHKNMYFSVVLSQNAQKVSHSCDYGFSLCALVVLGNRQLTFNFLNMFVSRGHPISLTAFSLIQSISDTAPRSLKIEYNFDVQVQAT